MSRIYTPARARNAKSKAVEPFFSRSSRKYCQGRIDRGGFGVASGRDLQPSGEFLGRHRHAFPAGEERRRRPASFIERERAGKRDEYASLFGKLPEERRLVLSGEQYLLTSGEGAGLRPTLLGGEERAYDSFAPEFREYARVRWSVKCAPDDLDRVLAVNGDGTLRFLPGRKHVQPMVLAGRKEGDSGELSRVSRSNGGGGARHQHAPGARLREGGAALRRPASARRGHPAAVRQPGRGTRRANGRAAPRRRRRTRRMFSTCTGN